MRSKKVKLLRKRWLKLEDNDVIYNINGQVVEGIAFRRFKKLKEVDRKAYLT